MAPGWLLRFKLRHGIRELSFQGESISADTRFMELSHKRLSKFIEDHELTLNQVINWLILAPPI